MVTGMYSKSLIDYSEGSKEAQVIRSVQSLLKEAMHKLNTACNNQTSVGQMYTLLGEVEELVYLADRKLGIDLPDDLVIGRRQHYTAGSLSPALVRVKQRRGKAAGK